MCQNTFKREPRLIVTKPTHQFSSWKNMNCSCVKVGGGGLNGEKGGMGPKDLPATCFLAAVRLCHLLNGGADEGKCVCSDTWEQIDGERWPPSVSIAVMRHVSAVTYFLFESCLRHFQENKMSCENLT